MGKKKANHRKAYRMYRITRLVMITVTRNRIPTMNRWAVLLMVGVVLLWMWVWK